MHIATLITLILISILIVMVRLLFSFSYETLIPWHMGFGAYLYIAFHFIIYLGREVYLQKAKHSSSKFFNYTYIPAFLSTIFGFAILFNFEVSLGSSSSDMPTGGWFVALVVYSFLLAIIIGVVVFLVASAKRKYEVIYKNSNSSVPYSKIPKLVIPLLIASIGYISFLIYSDYSTAGMKYNYTSDSNRSVMYRKATVEQDITYCDYITDDHPPIGCYMKFFEKNDEVVQAFEKAELTKILVRRNRKAEIKEYFAMYNMLNRTQCQRVKNPKLCESSLLKATHQILEIASKMKVIYADKVYKEIPKYLLINVPSKYKGTYDKLIKDLEKFKSSSIARIKRASNNHGMRIYIDINKLMQNESDLFAIERIIRKRQKSIYRRKLAEGVVQREKSKERETRKKLEKKY